MLSDAATISRPPRAEGAGSLNEVRAVIPPECYRRTTWRATLAVVQALALWLAPVTLLVLTSARWWSPLLVGLTGLAVAGMFVLGHDASHAALFPSKAVNRWAARGLMLPSLHNETAWDLGHNRVHHGYTARLGFDFIWHPSNTEQWAQMTRHERLRHRLEWSWLGAGNYYFRAVWLEKMVRFSPDGKRGAAYRRDNRLTWGAFGVLAATLAAIGAFQGGPLRAVWLVAATLVVPFLIFCHIIGWTVYVHHVGPSMRWWPRREWTQFKGQMESTTILEFPRLIDRLWLHHIFVHTPHHVDARIPFHRLPAAARAIEQAYPDVVRRERWKLSSYLQATRACKLYDADNGRWLRYP